MGTDSLNERHTGGDPWADLLRYSGFAFLLGLLLGLSAYLSSHRGGNTDWGPYADWVAAFGAIIAAGSTIAIAAVARREVKRREAQDFVEQRRLAAEGLELAIAIAAWPTAADMELAVRISRRTPLTPDVSVASARSLAKAACTFATFNELADLRQIIGLPPDVMRSVAIARGQMKLIHNSASSLLRAMDDIDESAEADQAQVQMLVANIEQMASHLMHGANFLHQKVGAVSDPPWKEWSPRRDFKALQAEIFAEYHHD